MLKETHGNPLNWSYSIAKEGLQGIGGLHYISVSIAARVSEAMATDREPGKIVMELNSHCKA